jgi:phage-related protein
MEKEWIIVFYEEKNGSCPVQEFLDSRDVKNRRKIISLIQYLQQMGINLPRPYSDILTDGIHELRIKLSGEETRTLYFFCFENYIVLTHTFIKTTEKVPYNEIKKAIQYREDFINRYKKNNIKEYKL